MKNGRSVRWLLSVVAVIAVGIASGWFFRPARPLVESDPEPQNVSPGAALGSADAAQPAASTVSQSSPRKEASPQNEADPPRHTNRLANETSPYLLLHKHNPVDWYPWGAEAFEKARREDKPIFLSIGYSACHWCHVMQRQSFSNEEIAKILNQHFVCIKLDREELPDVDDVYMSAVQIMNEGRGGWPLSAFLTPDLKPFFGGTYFPPDRFAQLLARIIEFWKDERAAADDIGDRVVRQLERFGRPRGFALRKLDREIAKQTVSGLAARFDPEYGGFGYSPEDPRIPKFPQPSILEFLAYMAKHEDDARARAMLVLTLDRIGLGGIRDHLGGGFHRYSTDRFWQVPHFEKMLYDNAQLARVFLYSYEITTDRNYAALAKSIFAFVKREMTSGDGAFYSALDAESEHEEGKFYVWTADEVKALLSRREYELFAAVNGLSGAPHIREDGQPDRYVIQLTESLPALASKWNTSPGDLAGLLHPAARKLSEARAKRPRPRTDTKVMTDWNALMIAALADGFRVLKEDEYREAATRAAEFILANCRAADGRLLHIFSAGSAKLPALVEDYAFLIQATLALEHATNDERWLGEARTLADEMVKYFWDESSAGFFGTASDQPVTLVRLKSSRDGVLPSGNSAAVRALIELAARTRQERYAELAGRTLAAFAGSLAVEPTECPNMVRGLCEYLDAKLPEANLAMRPGASAEPAVVRADAALSVDKIKPGREFQIAVVATINSEWHIYANPSSRPEFLPTTLTINSDLTLNDVRIKYPDGRPYRTDGVSEAINVYNGRAVIRATARLSEKSEANAGQLRLALRFQACNDQRCLAPKTLEVILPVDVAGPDDEVTALRPDLFGPPSQQP